MDYHIKENENCIFFFKFFIRNSNIFWALTCLQTVFVCFGYKCWYYIDSTKNYRDKIHLTYHVIITHLWVMADNELDMITCTYNLVAGIKNNNALFTRATTKTVKFNVLYIVVLCRLEDNCKYWFLSDGGK